MEELLNYNFDILDIKELVKNNPDLENIDKNDLNEKIRLLQDIKCSKNEIRNILMVNPFYLSANITNISNLLKYLGELGFNNLNFLIDADPFILDLDIKELISKINKELLKGKKFEDLILELETNPFLFNEI